MTTKRKARPAASDKASAADLENLALMLAGVLEHPALPPTLRQHIRYGLSEVFNELPDNERVTGSPDYITRLLSEHATQGEGGAR